MRHEEQDIDQECEQRHQQRRQKQNQQREKESRRMRRAVEVSGSRQTKANEGQESGNGMYDENRRERFAGTRRQVEVIAGATDVGCE